MADMINNPNPLVNTEDPIDTGYQPDVSVPDVDNVDIDTIKDTYAQASDSILDTPTTPKEPYVAPTIGEEPDRADYVDEKSTVQGQLSGLLSSDSKYMKAIGQGSREQSAALGMLDTSMSAGASTLAGIKAGVPIASQDADTYAKAQQAQQNAANAAFNTEVEGEVSGALQMQKYGLLNETQALQAAFDLAGKGADAETTAALQNAKSQWDFAIQDSMKRLEYNLSSSLQNREYDQQQAENLRASAVSMIENTQISIENMLKDPDMLELGSTFVADNINSQINLTTSFIEWSYDVAGANVDGYVSDLLGNLETIIEW